MPQVEKLVEEWKDAGYPKRLCPSIDRIDNSKGYIIGNLQWLPLWKNASKDAKPNDVGRDEKTGRFTRKK
jgi:hypothetical protein